MRKRLRRGVLLSFMWAMADALHQDYPLPALRKIRGFCLVGIKQYTDAEVDTLEELKVKAWELLSEKYEGDLNVFNIIDSLYFSFQDIFGERLKRHVYTIADYFAEGEMPLEALRFNTEVSEAYIELIDKVVFDYLKDTKCS